MSAPDSRDAVVATTVVATDPETAFEIFTEQVDAWWRQGPRFRTGAPGASHMRFERGVGGRLLEVFDEDADPFELGRVRAWDPPRRLAFAMYGRDFRTGDETTVEVRFEEVEGGTRVTVEHSGWAAFAADHPVRHGLEGEAFVAMMGVFWGDLLVSLRTAAVRDREERCVEHR